MNRRTRILILLALLVLLVASALVSTGLGAAGFIGPGAVLRAVASAFGWADAGGGSPDITLIVLQLRLPRIVLALLVGANLAVAGLIMQALFHNPLADPYIVGVSSGAALGAVTAITLGWQTVWLGLNAVALCAFFGAIAVTLLVYFIARRGNTVPLAMLLLTGIAVGGLAQAVTTLLLLQSGSSQLRSTFAWLLGSLAYRDWSYVQLLLPYTFLGIVATALWHRELNLLALGDEVAHHLGMELEKTKLALLIAASLLAASTVAACGTIGFVGLLVPNLMRLLVGANHRILLPATFLGGGLLVTWSDILARTISPGEEIPIGVVTSVLGCLFFLYLLSQQKRRS